MLQTELGFELEYSVKQNSDEQLPVIIVAAGNATRMKGIDKLFSEIKGLPVLVRTALAFERSERISEIIIITRCDKISECLSYADTYGIKKITAVAEGGNCREESVLKGIKLLLKRYSKVLIHDGARPLVSTAVINRVCDLASEHDSVSCGVKIKDTIKRINEDNEVIGTVNREALISIQTPQAVSTDMFLNAAEKFPLESFTDDTSVVEAVGAKTIIAEGDYKNIKITTPEDIKLAELYIDEN